jgi:hypothetical protein
MSDFLYVTDWRLVEGEMHRHFQSNAVRDITGTRELFSIPSHEARTRLRSTNSEVLGFLSHLHSLMVTVSQKSSLLQPVNSVSLVLIPDTPRTRVLRLVMDPTHFWKNLPDSDHKA